jgi:hypothetical protein
MHNFSLVGRVFLYFILQVEVVEIQIWIEFKLVCKLKKDLKKKRIFLIPIRYWAETWLETESGLAAASLSHSSVPSQNRPAPADDSHLKQPAAQLSPPDAPP